MSTNPFANSKAALVFAGLTIVSALIIASPQGGGRLIDNTAARAAPERETVVEEARAAPEKRSDVTEPLDPAAGWGGTAAPVFGDYRNEDPVPEPEEEIAEESAPAAPARSYPLSTDTVPEQLPVERRGTVVPSEDDAREEAASRAIPVVTSRTVRIEPQ